MDFNYLYHRQQVELMRAEAANCPQSAGAHRELASIFGSIIERRKDAVKRGDPGMGQAPALTIVGDLS